MAKTVTTTVTIQTSGDGVTATSQLQVENANGVGAGPFQMSLASGFQNVAIPSNAVGWSLIPPSTSAISKILKGVTGDTGHTLHPQKPTGPVYVNSSVQANVGLTLSGAEVVFWVWH